MKLNKFFMLGMAGLAFAACSNEEDVMSVSQLEGVGAVSVKIVNPTLTRAIAPATEGENNGTVTVVPTGNVTIKLEATSGGNTISLTPTEWGEAQEVTFWNVTGPQRITVTMNGGIDDYSSTSIVSTEPNLQALPENIPVYGSTTAITLTSNEDTPTSENDSHEIGASSEDVTNHTSFQMYEATVNLTIPVARLEVSGIKHGTGNFFSDLKIGGVYMDNVKPTGAGERTNYRFGGDDTGIGVEAILKTAIEPAENFLAITGKTEWPGQITGDDETSVDGAYAFNFYGATDTEEGGATTSEEKQALNPKFKIYFPKAMATEDGVEITTPRYAMITKYTSNGTDDIVLQNGHIYRIADVTLNDDNIIPNEDGKEVYGVTVTVVEAKWNIVDIQANWAGGGNE